MATTRKRKVVERALTNKGFRSSSTDHQWFVFYNKDNKKTIIKTKTSHGPGSKDIDRFLIGKMARQLKLSKSQFLELVDCSLDQSGYEELVSQFI